MQLPDLSRHDTTAKLLLHNAAHWGAEVVLREKEYGIWKVYTWADTRARVEELARGLLGLGIGRGDVVGIIGRNRPHWLWAEWAAHAVGAMSLGIYEDALGTEVAYLLGYAEARLVFVEDEEQADKVLEIADALPHLGWIVYNDPRGMRKYRDDRLLDRQQLIERGSHVPADAFEATVAAGRGADVAMLCTTSGTTSHPKLAMLQHRRLLEHGSAYLRADPREPSDEYVSVLPLPWIVEQVYVATMPLLSRIRVSFPEGESTVMHDLREIGPTHLLLAPRVWEQLAAEVHSRMLDANRVNQKIFDFGVKRGIAALSAGKRSRMADWLLFRTLRDRLGFARLRSAATGGSALGPDTFRFFLAMGVPLRQLYGQTEAAGAYTIQQGGELDFESSGKPFDNTEVRIEDPDPNGVGHIVTRHPNLFQGYFKQPDETAQQPDRGRVVPDRRCRLSGRARPADRDRSCAGPVDHSDRRALFAPVHREQAQVLAVHRRGRGARQRQAVDHRDPVHPLLDGRKVGREPRADLHDLHQPLGPTRGVRADRRRGGEGQRLAAAGAADHPFSAPVQGAGRG